MGDKFIPREAIGAVEKKLSEEKHARESAKAGVPVDGIDSIGNEALKTQGKIDVEGEILAHNLAVGKAKKIAEKTGSIDVPGIYEPHEVDAVEDRAA